MEPVLPPAGASAPGLAAEAAGAEGPPPAGQCAPHVRQRWIHSNRASALFGAIILLNSVLLGIETDHRPDAANPLSQVSWFAADSVFNAIYLVEVALRIEADRARWCCNGWNLFDAVLVLFGVVDIWIIGLAGLDSDNIRVLSIMRVFRLMRLTRLLRVLRLFRFLQELWLMLNAIVGAISAMAWSLLLLCAVLCISAIFTTRLVGQNCCTAEDSFTDRRYEEWFGTVPRSLFTLFQFATLENWPDIAREAFDESPLLVIFIIVFIMLTNIMLLNTLAGIVVENVLSVAQKEEQSRCKALEEQQRQALRDVFDCMDTDEDGNLEWEELQQPAKPAPAHSDSSMPSFLRVFSSAGLSERDLGKTMLEVTLQHANMSATDAKELFQMLDTDGSGMISKDEFVESVMHATVPPTAMNLLHLGSHVNHAGSRLRALASQLQALDEGLRGLGERLQGGGQSAGGPSKQPPAAPPLAALPPAVPPGAAPVGATPADAATELAELRQDMLWALADFEVRLAAQLGRRREMQTAVEPPPGAGGSPRGGQRGKGEAAAPAQAEQLGTPGGTRIRATL